MIKPPKSPVFHQPSPASFLARMIGHDWSSKQGHPWSRVAVAVFFCALMLAWVAPSSAQAVDSSTVHVISAALVGRGSLAPGDSEKIQAGVAVVLKEQKITELVKQLKDARIEYIADRKKFSAERDSKIKKRYQQALDETVKAVRNAIKENDPATAALLVQAGSAKSAKQKGEVVEYEGENATDSAAKNKLAVKPIKDEPGLPRVLLIGDSISIGYTLQVRELLKGKANVHRIPVNGGATEVGLANMTKWLGDGKWDVIHFNFGLHDAKFASETTQRASREQYAENLRKLVTQMKSTGAKLIFATTTPIPNDGNISPTRRFDSIPARNEVARKVMEENGVAIDDLYSLVLPVRATVGRSNDVHFQPAGYDLLAKQIAAVIETKLPSQKISAGAVPVQH
jgi:acyl-CoA thioesterase-1